MSAAAVHAKAVATPKPQPRGYGELPVDTILHVFGFLDPNDLITAKMVNTTWRNLLLAKENDSIWEAVYRLSFPDSVFPNPALPALPAPAASASAAAAAPAPQTAPSLSGKELVRREIASAINLRRFHLLPEDQQQKLVTSFNFGRGSYHHGHYRLKRSGQELSILCNGIYPKNTEISTYDLVSKQKCTLDIGGMMSSSELARIGNYLILADTQRAQLIVYKAENNQLLYFGTRKIIGEHAKISSMATHNGHIYLSTFRQRGDNYDNFRIAKYDFQKVLNSPQETEDLPDAEASLELENCGKLQCYNDSIYIAFGNKIIVCPLSLDRKTEFAPLPNAEDRWIREMLIAQDHLFVTLSPPKPEYHDRSWLFIYDLKTG